MASTDSFTFEEAFGAGQVPEADQPFTLEEAFDRPVTAPAELPKPLRFPSGPSFFDPLAPAPEPAKSTPAPARIETAAPSLPTSGIPGVDPAVLARATAASPLAQRDVAPSQISDTPAPAVAPSLPVRSGQPSPQPSPAAAVPDALRQNAENDLEKLKDLKPPEDQATGLSLRQDTEQASRYRAALDEVLARYGSHMGFKQALAGQAPPAAVPTPTAAAFTFEEAFADERVDPDAQGLARSALHAIVQGAAGGAAGFPEDVAVLRQDAARSLLAQYDKIDGGALLDPKYRTPPGPAMFYLSADQATREKLREKTRALIRPVEEEPAFALGQRIRDVAAETFPVSPEHEESFFVKAGRGIGSTVIFVGTGVVGKVFKLPAIVVTAGAGAVVNSAETFRDALRSGASFEDAQKAARFSAVIGTSEALPVARIFDRIDKATGRSLRKIITQSLKGGFEEGVQELFQNVSENLIASKLVKYDPDRETFHGSGDAAGVGFTVGALFNFLAAMLGGRVRGGPPPVPPPTVEQPEEAPPAPPPSDVQQATPEEQRRGEQAESLREVLEDEPPQATPADLTAAEQLAAELPAMREEMDESQRKLEAAITAAAAQADPDPSEAEKEAGNYQKGHVSIQGLDITIETPKGAMRSGIGPDGVPWTVQLPAHYGYIKRTDGADGEQIDVYIGPNPGSQTVWIVDQIDIETGKFDEHKVMLGFASSDEAQASYVEGFSDNRGVDRLGDMTPLPIEDFKVWVQQGKKDEPVGDIETAQDALETRRAVIEESAEPPHVTSLQMAETGKPFAQRLYRGFGRETKDDPEIFTMPGVGPILGPALYYANDPEVAARFGPRTDDRIVSLDNPLVIDSDQQWRELTTRAGWEFPNPFRLDPADAPKMREETEALRSLIQSMGHDGVVIRLADEVPLRGPRLGPGVGDRTKTLTNVFGDDQVVVFGQAAEPVGTALAGLAPSDRGDGGAATPVPSLDEPQPTIPIEDVDPDSIEFDAELFQFKSGADARGVTEALAGVEEFDPFLADNILVYEFTDGRRIVADGHQRLALAQRVKTAGQTVKLRAFVLREADGVTVSEARIMAAGKNIGQGTGTALDAAKIIREAGLDVLPAIPLGKPLVRDARALANLGDRAFGMVANGVAEESHGAAVGALINDAEQQVAILDLLTRLGPANRIEATALVQEAIIAGFEQGTQETLFGTEQITDSLLLERARIKTAALRQIRRDRATFNSLLDRSGVITQEGNILDQGANQRRVGQDDALLQIIGTLATRSGAVSEALATAARELKAGRSINESTRGFIDAIKGAIAQGDLERFSVGTPRGRKGPRDRRQDTPAQERGREGPGAIDLTDQGEQRVIPGAERITDKEFAERQIEGKLRPKVAQKEADFGLFDEDAGKQGELFSRGTRRPIVPAQSATRTAYQLAQAARDYMPMKRLLERAGLRLRVIDNNRLGITLDQSSTFRLPALRALTKVAKVNGTTLIIENPPTDPKALELYDNLAFRRDGNGQVFYEPGAGEPNYSVGMVGFYSKLERTIEQRMPAKASTEQVRGIINNAAIKQEEVDWSDIMRWLDGWPSRLPIEKTLVLEFIRANQVRIIAQPPRVSTVIEDLFFADEEVVEPSSDFIQEIAAEDYFEDALEDVLSEDPRYANLPSGTRAIAGSLDRLVKEEDEDLALEAMAEAKARSESRAFDRYMEDPERRTRETTYGYEIVRDPDAGFSHQIFDPDKVKIGETVTMGSAHEMIAEHARNNFGQAADGEFGWESYTEPGGEDYQEILLVWANPPEATTYSNEAHWENDKNFIAHVRTNVREDTQGRRILFIEEAQSDWHQQGRDQGYTPTTKLELARFAEELSEARNALADVKMRALDLVISDPENGARWRRVLEIIWTAENGSFAVPEPIPNTGLANSLSSITLTAGQPAIEAQNANDIRAFLPMSLRKEMADADAEAVRLFDLGVRNRSGVPSAPFKGRAWHELVMKRMLRMTVDQGLDGLAWTSGEQQNERYNLAQVVDQIQVTYIGTGAGSQERDLRVAPLQSDGPYTIRALRNDTVQRTFQAAHRGDLERFLGRGLTEEILQRGFIDGGFQREGTIILRPEDFTIGNEGMRRFYGSIDPATGELTNGILGRFLNRYTKKWGGRVETTAINFPNIDPRFRVRPLQIFPDQPNVAAADRSGPRPAGDTVNAWQVYDTESGLYLNDTISTVQGEAVVAAQKFNLASQQEQDIKSVPFIAITERMRGGVAEGQSLFAAQPRPADPRLQALADEVIAIAQQMAPKANLRLVRRMFAEGGENRNVELSGGASGQEVAGSFAEWEDLITIALNFSDPEITIRHETIHHLRATGLLNDREWDILAAQAERWRQEFELLAGENPEESDLVAEEAVAYAFQEHHAGTTVQRGNIARIFNKIMVFFRRLMNALRGNGFQTFEDVFGKVESGEVGRRPQTFRKAGRERFSTGRRPQFNDNFWKWFGPSKVVNDDGSPRRVFRGDNRLDRFGAVFKKGKSTVGGFYFTTDPEIASSYAMGKPDSNAREDLALFEDWYTFPPPAGQRRRLNLRHLWFFLDSRQKAKVKDVLLKTGLTDEGAFDFSGENQLVGPDAWDYWANVEHRGNWLMAGVEGWLNSAMIFNEEERFGEILREMGLTDYQFDSPMIERPGVTPVYLSIRNPLDTAKIKGDLIDRIVALLRRSRSTDKGDWSGVTPKQFGEILRTEFDERRAKLAPGDDPEVDMSDSMVWSDIPVKVIDFLRTNGFDGIRDRGGKMGGAGHDVWIVFDPWQIKSIHNRGTWDPGKRDIRYAARWNRPGRRSNPLFGYSFTLPSPNVLDHLRARNRTKVERLSGAFQAASDPARVKLQDRFLSLRRIQEQIALQRGLRRLPQNIDAYMAEELFHGRTGQRLAEFQQLFVEPLVERMEETGVTLEEIEEYLYARHATERNTQIAKINPQMPDGGSGMTNAEAADIIDNVTRSGRLALLDQIAALVDAINQERLNILEAEGLISPQDRLVWSQTYRFYVPLRGLDDDEFSDTARQGRGFDIRGQESKRALGRESQAKDILAYVLSQMEEAIVRSEKNRVGRTFLRLVEANPNPDVWELTQVEYTRRINRKTGLVEAVPDPAFKLADNVLAVKVGGQVKHVTIFKRDLARAMKNLGAESVDILTRALLKTNRYLAAINTSFNPEFIVSNLTRDVQTAGINIQEFDIEGAARHLVRDIGKAMRGVWRGQQGKFDTDWAKWFKEFSEAGGTVGFYSLLDVPARVRRINRLIQNLKPGKLGTARRATFAAFTFIQDVNMAVENATRLSAYVQARRSGLSIERSASLAKNLTVNFNRKGEWASVANGLYLFYNASLQGSFRMLSALRNRRVQAVVLAIIGGHVALEIVNQMLAQAIQGDDGDNDWDKVSKWTKEHNIMLINPMPLMGVDVESPVAFKLPMPYGYNVFAVMGQKIGEMIMGKNDPLNAAIEVTLAAINSFNPMGGEESFIQLISPTIVDPAVEIAINRDFAGRPIMPDQPAFGAQKPDSQLYWNSTDGTMTQWTTERLNELTGGSQFRPGVIDLSPETIDHWFAFWTGGVGTFMQRNVDFTIKLINGEPIPVRRIPFLRKVLEGKNEFYVGHKYREIRDQALISAHEVKILRSLGQSDNALEARARTKPDLRIDKMIRRVDRKLSRLRKQRDRIRADTEMPADAKDLRLEGIRETMEGLMQKVIDRHRALLKLQEEGK